MPTIVDLFKSETKKAIDDSFSFIKNNVPDVNTAAYRKKMSHAEELYFDMGKTEASGGIDVDTILSTIMALQSVLQAAKYSDLNLQRQKNWHNTDLISQIEKVLKVSRI